MSPATTQKRRADRGTGRDGGTSMLHISKLESPLTTYYLIVGSSITLVVLGLVMVFSASSVTSLIAKDPPYAVFIRQFVFAVIGAAGALVAARLSIRWWRWLAAPAYVGAVALLALVAFTPLGVDKNGNRNWLDIGGLQIQPSEFGKLALVLVGAVVFTNKGTLAGRFGQAMVPYVVPVAAVLLGLVLAGSDLGTAVIMLLIVVAVLWVGGAPRSLFVIGGVGAALLVLQMVTSSNNRMSRISNWLSEECQSNPDGYCGQMVHGLYALADGGWIGVGLGNSKEKWAWLAEAHNDFIFAIIGEELGLPGTLLILILFGLLAWGCYRLISRTQDRFVRVATAGVMAWLLGQAVVNIGSVIGLLPVIGVPLPLVSAGGSSLVAAMIALGMLASFARNEPGCKDLLDARPSLVSRTRTLLPSSLRRRNR